MRGEEALALRTALIGELNGIREALKRTAEDVEKDDPTSSHFLIPDIASGVRVMPLLLPKFGLLSSDHVQQVIDTYVTIDKFRDKLVLLAQGPAGLVDASYRGGFLQMPVVFAASVGPLGRSTAEKIDATISSLNASD